MPTFLSQRIRFRCCVLALLAAGCATQAPYVWFSALPAPTAERLSVVEPTDRVSVVVLDHPELSGEYLVAADGSFVQPLAGPVFIAGKTLDAGARHIADRLAPYLQQPAVSVALVQPHLIRVNVVGEVRAPGSFEVRYDEGMIALLARSGGFSDFANRDGLYLVRRDGSVPRIRFRYEDLKRPHPRVLDFQLVDGDTLIVE